MPQLMPAIHTEVMQVFREACKILHNRLHPSVYVAHALLATLSNLDRATPSLAASHESARFIEAAVQDYLPITGLVQEHTDIFPSEKFVGHVEKGKRMDCSKAWQLGRPLWAAVEVEQGAPARNKAVWAARKLLCTTQTQLDAGPKRRQQMLALLYSRVAGFVLPKEQAEGLVASHMATALAYEDGFILAQYMSEPALAEGAKYVTEINKIRLCATVLDEVSSVLSPAPPHPGDLGELGACALLLQAYDDCDRESDVSEDDRAMKGNILRTWEKTDPLSSCITVASFLNCLVGTETRSWKLALGEAFPRETRTRKGIACHGRSELFLNKLGGGYVSFNHFVRVGHIDNLSWPRLLTWAWERHAAIICPHGFPGVDLVIPIWYTSADDGSTRMGAVLVQVKNTDSPFPGPNYLLGAEAIGFEAKDATFLGVFLGIRLRRNEEGQVLKRSAKPSQNPLAWKASFLGTTTRTPALIANDLDCIACLRDEDRTALASFCNLHRSRPEFVRERYDSATGEFEVESRPHEGAAEQSGNSVTAGPDQKKRRRL